MNLRLERQDTELIVCSTVSQLKLSIFQQSIKICIALFSGFTLFCELLFTTLIFLFVVTFRCSRALILHALAIKNNLIH